jgi:YesN/AraC family two-component response regulator
MKYSQKEIKLYAKNKSILIVDDDEMTRKIINAILSEYFEAIDIASDGEEAIRLFREKEYDIVLTDINMPQIDGVSLIRRIKHEKFDQSIVVISSVESIDEVLSLFDLGIESFIKKPLDFQTIVIKINNVLENIFFRNILKEYNNKKLIENYKKSITPKEEIVATPLSEDSMSAKEFVAKVKSEYSQLDEIIDEIKHIAQTIEDTISYVEVNGLDEDSIVALSKGFSNLYNTLSIFDELATFADTLYEINDVLVEVESDISDIFGFGHKIVIRLKEVIDEIFVSQTISDINEINSEFEDFLFHLKREI